MQKQPAALHRAFALALLLLALAALCLIACGDDQKPPAGDDRVAPGIYDPSTSGSRDGGSKPTPDNADADAGPPLAKTVVVHAATDLGPHNKSGGIRLCFFNASAKDPKDDDFSPSPFLASPWTGSMELGTGGSIFPSNMSGADSELVTIRPYMLSADALIARGIDGNDAGVPGCKALLAGAVDGGGGGGIIDGGSLVANQDFWQLPDFAVGTFKRGKTYVLALVGCTSDAVQRTPTSSCGEGYTPTGTPGVGNLKFVVSEVHDSDVANDELGIQLLHVSPQYDAYRTAHPDLVPELEPYLFNVASSDAGAVDGSLLTPGASPFTYENGGAKVTPLVKLKGIDTTTAYFAANASSPASPPGTPFLSHPLNNTGGQPSIQFLQTGLTTTIITFFLNRRTYTIVLIGDPALDATLEPNRSFHVIAFFNSFITFLLK